MSKYKYNVKSNSSYFLNSSLNSSSSHNPCLRLIIYKLSSQNKLFLKMPRPRRAAAEKAKGHYSETTRSETRKKRGATADPVEAAEAGPSKRPRGSKKSEDTKMKGTEDEKEEDPNLPLGLSTRSFTHEELMDDLNVCYIDLIPPASFDLPKRQKRWTQPESKPPIESIEKAPEGWNMDEPDLDPTYVPFLFRKQ
jgi:hypothetical protein